MTARYTMVGQHAYGKMTRDAIFTAGARADQAMARVGRDRVVNATVGLILDDKEQTAILPTVHEVLRSMGANDFASYSPFLGSLEFRAAVKSFMFGDHLPEAHVEVVATPGSTGALRNAFWNYLDIGDVVLVPNWRWSPYDTIASEHLRKIETFELFERPNGLQSEAHRFSLSDLKTKLESVFARQSRAIVVVNDPAHNPTGYDMTLEEWRELMEMLRGMIAPSLSGATERRLTLFIDAPYIDYASQGNRARALFQQLLPIPQNMLIAVGYSISKSLTQYGMRTGACIGISQDRGVMDEFLEVNGASARAVWTNVPRAGMQLCSILHREKGLLEKVNAEREVLRRMLNYRAAVFLEEAEEVGLVPMPYRSGFFISVPTPDPEGLTALLAEKQIFVVPMDLGIRIAISGIPARKISGVAAAVHASLQQQAGQQLVGK